MRGASYAIRRSFRIAEYEMEELAELLEEEMDGFARLSSYVNITETEKISDALAEALKIMMKAKMRTLRIQLKGRPWWSFGQASLLSLWRLRYMVSSTLWRTAPLSGKKTVMFCVASSFLPLLEDLHMSSGCLEF